MMMHRSYRVAVLAILFSVNYVGLAEADDIVVDSPADVCLLENEEYSLCGTSCPLTCDNLDPPMCDKKCNQGCFCKGGFVRNSNGECIRPEDCPLPNRKSIKCTKPNEEFTTCGSSCPRNCTNYWKIEPCNLLCNVGCFCREGFVRDKEGNCVWHEECPIPDPEISGCTRPNEEFTTCGTSCPRNCTNYWKLDACNLLCNIGCFCKKGFVRDNEGNCIMPEDCPSEPPPLCLNPNEEFTDCGTSCPRTCENYWDGDLACDYKCNIGCFCKDGYIRDNDGNCVLPVDCPFPTPKPIECTKPNEEFTTCGTSCPRNCTNYWKLEACNLLCNTGCFCKKGFVRDDKGNCILPEKCPLIPVPAGQMTCTRPNEEFTQCASRCPDYCSNYGIMRPCPYRCLMGCVCKKGFVRDDETDDCILPEECIFAPTPLPQTCNADEKWNNCGTLCPITCDNYQNPPLACQAMCVPGCFCKAGLVRASDGSCIPSKDCPKKPPQICSRPNEEFTECGTSCPRTCKNYWDDDDKACDFKCNIGCFCKDGYVRDHKGNCILPEECSMQPPHQICTKPNEEFTECGTSCPRTCRNFWHIGGICNLRCNSGCFCKPGYVRDDRGNCILPDDCPRPQGICRRPNEIFRRCKSMCPDTCENYGTVRPCILPCFPGCDCRPGYVRDSQRNCILPEQCDVAPPPQTCSKPNEEYTDCGTSCPRTCKNFWDDNVKCDLKCNSGCFCKHGYVRDNGGNCILPEECPPDFPVQYCLRPNEEFSDCGTSCPRTCRNYQEIGRCDLKCNVGCFCKYGYVRDDKGDCILPQNCPPVAVPNVIGFCRRPNEIFSPCKSMCPDTCDNYGTPRPCILPCIPGCDCKAGYVRDSQGNCILPEECKVNKRCGPREVYKECGSACPDTCKNYWIHPRACTKNCVQGCFCRKGYVRDWRNKCIRPKYCPRRS